uniref:(northern house mosquito) hypothetical protein n=1 Tax=Culex pipiens TaxID=7175 RepID=A0A8D8G8Z8_CULPI
MPHFASSLARKRTDRNSPSWSTNCINGESSPTSPQPAYLRLQSSPSPTSIWRRCKSPRKTPTGSSCCRKSCPSCTPWSPPPNHSLRGPHGTPSRSRGRLAGVTATCGLPTSASCATITIPAVLTRAITMCWASRRPTGCCASGRRPRWRVRWERPTLLSEGRRFWGATLTRLFGRVGARWRVRNSSPTATSGSCAGCYIRQPSSSCMPIKTEPTGLRHEMTRRCIVLGT